MNQSQTIFDLCTLYLIQLDQPRDSSLQTKLTERRNKTSSNPPQPREQIQSSLHRNRKVSSHFLFLPKAECVTVRDSYPLPGMDECSDSLGRMRIFSTFNANFGYRKVKIEERDREKSTSTSHHGLYPFVRMSCGLKSALATIQRAMDVIWSFVNWKTALVLLEDIVFYLNRRTTPQSCSTCLDTTRRCRYST